MTIPSAATKDLLIKLIARADKTSARKKLMHAIDYLKAPDSYARPRMSNGQGRYDRIVMN